MRRFSFAVVWTFATLFLVLPSIAAGAPAPAAPEAAMPFLPGIVSPDEHPRGCVDCHVYVSDDKDFRLNKAVAIDTKHPNIANAFKGTLIPDSCMLCHKEGSKLGSLSARLHKVHYQNLQKNPFITVYQGSCLNCHKIEMATGHMALKSGPANW
jgi:hypothetical protein